MEFPSGHHTHRHHRRDDDDEESPGNRPYPPPGPPDFYGQPPPPRPPFYGGGDDDFAPPPPPPSNVYHTSHSSPPSAYPPPQDHFASGYSSPYAPPPQSFSQGSTEYSDYPPPPPATYQHVVDEVDEPSETHHSHRPHMPAFLHRHTLHQSDSGPAAAAAASGGGALGSYFANRPTYKVYCKAEPNYLLTIRDSKVILASSDSSDPYQKWYKDEKFSTRVKDEEGFPCFSLVNKATGEAIKHSVGASHPVQLVPYDPEQLDASVLWTESKDLRDGYRTVRMVNNVRLNLDAFHGDKKSGGVHDGTTIVLWQWNKGDNQRWKIAPYCKFFSSQRRPATCLFVFHFSTILCSNLFWRLTEPCPFF